MQLIKGVGNLEIIGWTIFSILSCFVVAFPLSYFFHLDDIHWRVPKGGKYADYEKSIEARNVVLRDAFNRLHAASDSGGAIQLPYFTPEVYCPLLVAAGGRKLCAPWMFDTPVVLNRVDVEIWKEKKKRVVLKKHHYGEKEDADFEGAGCRAYSLHNSGEQREEDREWKEALRGCTFEMIDGVKLTPTHGPHALYASAKDMEPISAADMKAAGVCQLVLDLASNEAQTVKDLRNFGEKGYRIMSYEKIESDTARFSFILSNCTDHFGAKYIKKYLV